MSFILDALRRAEAQRERGQVPGLHSQTMAAAASVAPVPRRSSPWVALLAVLCALLIVALAAMWWRLEPVPVDAVTSAPAAVVAAASVPASVPTTARPSASASAPASVAPPVAPSAALPASTAPSLLAAVAPPARASSLTTRSPAAARAKVVPAPAAVPSAAAAARRDRPAAASAVAAAASAAPPLLAAGDLPEPWRSTVARLNVSGAVHSSDPTQSFVMVGGQLAREGDRVAPDISIERIGARETVLRAGPHRVEIRY